MGASSHPSSHPSSLETRGLANSPQARGVARRSPRIDSRPILLPEPDPEADLRPSETELNDLMAGLTGRDLAILNALDEYRYLDLEQVRQLFFAGRRQAQIRTKWLRVSHLIQRWTAMQPPGWHRLHSVLLLSMRGAGVLAATRGHDTRPYTRRARDRGSG